MKNLTVGILAHVDAGKTTLSESILYLSGSIRKLGRVDTRDAFLDTDILERERGITIFSKQAVFEYENARITLVDTPGHVDFSAEMERTLRILDYAVLVISGADGVQGHTRTLWKLLGEYNIPTFIFVNKMDQAGTDKNFLIKELKHNLSDSIVDFTQDPKEIAEDAAECDEDVLEKYLEKGAVDDADIIRLTAVRKLFPCFFGAALKMQGVKELLDSVCRFSLNRVYPDEFGAVVFKITRDEQNNRLTHLKVTGGTLKIKDQVDGEKVNQIRIYSGAKYEAVNEAKAGVVCAVTGLNNTRPGMGIGSEEMTEKPLLGPVLNYKVILPEKYNVNDALAKLKQLEEEIPEIEIEWNGRLKEIHARLMGEIQTEILKEIVARRYGFNIDFGTGRTVYKETILDTVEGVGHFEPLRHYAEVHLILEPLEPGSGLVYDTVCSEDSLDKNWQRLILTHLAEKEHKGVLTGSAITDMKITLVAGKAHLKHTEGGDFRQATYRAVRQGLEQAKSILLEPVYDFLLEVPSDVVGRAMSDIDRMKGTFNAPETQGDMSVIRGSCPVATMRDYCRDVISYSRGLGKLTCTVSGYAPCHNEAEVIESIGYDSEADTENPAGSVFCSHGAGFNVGWDEVKQYMHIPAVLEEPELRQAEEPEPVFVSRKEYADSAREEKELEEIFLRTYGGIKESRNLFHTNMSNNELRNKKTAEKNETAAKPEKPYIYKPGNKNPKYLLVDGYNIIFAWPELKELAAENINSAQDRLLDILCNYQGIRNINVVAVFDAYKVKGYTGETRKYNNVSVVYTKEDQTADQYIEQFAHKMRGKFDITVATSDGLEQVTILSQGCTLMSARELKSDVEYCNEKMRERIMPDMGHKGYLFDNAGKDVKEYIKTLHEDV